MGKGVNDREAGLHYPGKIVFDRRTGLLAVADTALHRIVISDRHGTVKKIIGSGRPGRSGGPFTAAEFCYPRGMVFFRGKLYIADTGSHLIREVDFASEKVVTAAGTGERRFLPGGCGPPLETALNYPWDMAAAGEKIYVAMAGSHQVWEFDPCGRHVRALAGTGEEGLRDGTLESARFAWPAGLSSDQAGIIYCADMKTGAIRRIDLNGGLVETLVGLVQHGTGPVNFSAIKLRLPLGVSWDCSRQKLYVADSRNHRVVELDPVQKTSRLAASGLNSPGGLTAFDSGLLVADTNAHRIIKVTGEVVEEFRLNWPGQDFLTHTHYFTDLYYIPSCRAGACTPGP